MAVKLSGSGLSFLMLFFEFILARSVSLVLSKFGTASSSQRFILVKVFGLTLKR
jgi:hypothetical protein